MDFSQKAEPGKKKNPISTGIKREKLFLGEAFECLFTLIVH